MALSKSTKPDLFPKVEEIREMIFANLSINRLFVIQGVSQSWKASIEGSPKLGQKMFLTAKSTPLDPIKFPVDTDGKHYTSRRDMAAQYPNVLTCSPLIPSLVPWNPRFANLDFPITSKNGVEASNEAVFVEFLISTNPPGVWGRKDSSFRRTFVTQPPVKEITIFRTCGRFQSTKVSKVVREGGIRCGDVIDEHEHTWKDMNEGWYDIFNERIMIYLTIRNEELDQDVNHKDP